MRPRTVLAYGVFDSFTPQHADRLRTMARLGSRLIIGVASDGFCARHGVFPRARFETRAAMVASCRYVDHVIPQHSTAQMHTDVINHDASVLVLKPSQAQTAAELAALTQIIWLEGTAARVMHAA